MLQCVCVMIAVIRPRWRFGFCSWFASQGPRSLIGLLACLSRFWLASLHYLVRWSLGLVLALGWAGYDDSIPISLLPARAAGLVDWLLCSWAGCFERWLAVGRTIGWLACGQAAKQWIPDRHERKRHGITTGPAVGEAEKNKGEMGGGGAKEWAFCPRRLRSPRPWLLD